MSFLETQSFTMNAVIFILVKKYIIRFYKDKKLYLNMTFWLHNYTLRVNILLGDNV